MALFQKTVISKYLQTQTQKELKEKWDLFRAYFQDSEIQENIRNSKEEQYQGEFLIDLFVNILGYTKNPTANFNLTTEYKNVKDSKKADGAIVINNEVTAIIELKGTNTIDLSKVEDQAFGYKNNQENCKYVITSNFEKLRFYVDNAIEHIEFNLFALTQDQFNLMYLLLAFENIKNDIPKKLKDESLNQEDIVTKKLYKDYSVFKRELFRNLTALNPEYDALLLFQKSQKLLDRLLFLFFGEDRGLLPPNYIRKIIGDWTKLKDLDAYFPLYDRYKQNFEYLNSGANKDVFAYNGGLFKTDEVLDQIKIDDKLLYDHTFRLSQYDFASEIDVNILGHIFENSLNEIDEIKAQLDGQEIDKFKSKRKKDGVFYTPKYITKYIVENTVGKLCGEKKVEYEIVEDDYITDKKRQQKTKENLLSKLDQYRAWLLQLTIVDPACGSGAFLNEALNFLITEHQYVDELEAKLTNSSFAFTYHSESILEHNLFGVDLNEESVEIAKLSLWLRTAEPNRKLNSLNDNIKCGNSLIDDAEVAGDKAFNWEKEFPQVFAKGGFDVVIGNPPYVFARENFEQKEKDFFIEKFTSAKYQINTYLLFIEKTVNILKENGVYGLIIPNSWLMMYSGEDLRKFLLEKNRINQIVNLAGFSFESANVETVILLARKEVITDENSIKILLNNGNEFYTSHCKNQNDFLKNDGFEFKVFLDDATEILNSKILNGSKELNDLVDIKAGLQAYEKDKGEPKQTAEDVKNRPYDYNFRFDDNTFKYLDGKDVGRYFTNWSGLYLSYGKHLAAPRTFNLFDGKKIIVREITGTFPKCLITTYSEEVYLYNRSNIAVVEKENSSISLKYIISLLNSTLLSYYFMKNTAKSVRKLFPKIILNDLRKFPVKNIAPESQKPFIIKADQMLSLTKDLQEISGKFQRSCERKFEGLNLTKKLQDWYNLSYGDFIKELSKQKIKLSLSEESDWEDYFTAEKSKALSVQNRITATDDEIDKMVYELYGFNEEEVGIVENN